MRVDPCNLNWKESHEIMVGAIVPRSIALVSTVGIDGVYNVAPFSFFTGISVVPMLVGIHIGWKRDKQKKDTLLNIEATQEFVINIVNEDLAEAMNKTSENFPSDVDEFKIAGLTPVKADLVRSPMVAESPVNMECKVVQILQFGTERYSAFIIGEIVRVHIKDELYVSNLVPISPWDAIGRMGEYLYCRTKDVFEMESPTPFG